MSVVVREKVLKDGTKSLYLDIYHNGKRVTESLDLRLTSDRQFNKEVKILAEKIRGQKEIELQANDYNLTALFKKKTDFIEYFRKTNYDKISENKESGNGNIESVVSHLIKFNGNEVLQIGSITKEWIESFQEYLVKAKLKINTINQYLTRMKTALTKAVKAGYILRNPFENFTFMKRIEAEKSFLYPQEIQRLEATPCKYEDIKIAFLFACYTGLRRSDLYALTWIDIKDGKIHFRQKKTSGYEYQPLNKTALAILDKCKEVNLIPLPTMKIFKSYSKDLTNDVLRRWAVDAGICKHISFHTSRHTFATSLIIAGVDLYTVSKLMGHKDISTTAIYAKIIDEKKLKAVESLDRKEAV